MISIYKYKLFDLDISGNLISVCTEIQLSVPSHHMLDIQVQNHSIVAWFVVDTDSKASQVVWPFQIYGTGWNIDPDDFDNFFHLKTLSVGSYVWHIFSK